VTEVNCAELFRCFAGTAVRMRRKGLRLDMQFDLATQPGKGLDPNDSTLKAMREAARQLGRAFDTEG